VVLWPISAAAILVTGWLILRRRQGRQGKAGEGDAHTL